MERKTHIVAALIWYLASLAAWITGVVFAVRSHRYDVATFWIALAIGFDRYADWNYDRAEKYK